MKTRTLAFINTNEFLIGTFIGFSLTMLAFTFILTQCFVSRDFLKQNNLYLDGKYYSLCKNSRKAIEL